MFDFSILGLRQLRKEPCHKLKKLDFYSEVLWQVTRFRIPWILERGRPEISVASSLEQRVIQPRDPRCHYFPAFLDFAIP